MRKYEKPSMDLILLQGDLVVTSYGLNNGGTGGTTGGNTGSEGYGNGESYTFGD